MSAQRRIWRAGRPVNLMQSWSTWRRGTGDPSYRVDAGAHWRALGTPAGAATLRAQVVGEEVVADAWGPGAAAPSHRPPEHYGSLAGLALGLVFLALSLRRRPS